VKEFSPPLTSRIKTTDYTQEQPEGMTRTSRTAEKLSKSEAMQGPPKATARRLRGSRMKKKCRKPRVISKQSQNVSQSPICWERPQNHTRMSSVHFLFEPQVAPKLPVWVWAPHSVPSRRLLQLARIESPLWRYTTSKDSSTMPRPNHSWRREDEEVRSQRPQGDMVVSVSKRN